MNLFMSVCIEGDTLLLLLFEYLIDDLYEFLHILSSPNPQKSESRLELSNMKLSCLIAVSTDSPDPLAVLHRPCDRGATSNSNFACLQLRMKLKYSTVLLLVRLNSW